MGGRPQVVGLIAFAVAVWFASPVAAPPAAAEIRVPLPGFEAKKKIKRKRYTRPTVPSRNPTRATAGLSASAVSPPQAKDSEVAAAAGATSSASVSLALPRKPDQPAEAEAEEQTKTAAASEGTGPDASDAPEAPSEVAATDTETAPEDAKAEDAKEETSTETAEPATNADDSAADAVETTADATESVADTVEAVTGEAEQQVAAAAEATSATAEAAERTAEPDAEATDDADEEKAADADATLAPSEDNEDVLAPAADEPAEPKAETTATEPAEEENSAPEPAKIADESKDESAPAEDVAADTTDANDAKEVKSAAVATEAAILPDHDAAVVLEVAPPPGNISSTEDAQTENNSSETDVAVLTPPSTPDKRPPDSEDTTSEATQPDSAPTEAESEGTAVDADAAADSNTEEDVAAEPAPPPAHPVVAQIREALQDPALAKTVAKGDLEALKSFYGTHEGPPLWVTDDGLTAKAQDVIVEIGKADDWGLAASSFKLPRAENSLTTPDALADTELQLSIATLGYARDAQIGRLTPRRVSKLFDQRPSLRDPATVLEETAAASNPRDYLLSLHPQHNQFKRLQKALLNARQGAEATGRDPTTDQGVQLITINMERWRWLPRDLGNYHVWNNVPEFNVRVKKNGRTIYQGKTIVGQLKYATPFFSAKMRNIVFHPNWTVPPTIVKEDIAPKLQGNASGGFFGNSKEAVLRRYGLKAKYKGEPINADTVDWKNVNVHAYTFVQDPGPANVLGKFKFNFPNKHAIYMHDTVQPELFSQTTRTLSHGCIRVHQPDRFATLILSEDKGWTAGNVQSLVARNQSKVIALKRHVPVHLTYFTAIVDEHGNLNKAGDIYGIDNLMAPKLFSNPASFPVPPPAVVAESSPSRTQSRRGRRRGGGDFNNFISGLFGN